MVNVLDRLGALTGEAGHKDEGLALRVTRPNMQRVMFRLHGTAPYVQLRFGEKAKAQMRDKMLQGSQARKGTKRAPRDFDDDYQHALYESTAGWRGIPASSFRNAMISACRTVGFKMTLAKLSVFVEADGYDVLDGSPLIRIHGEPEKVEHAVRNETGVADLRVRAMWREWYADVRVRFDGDQFSPADVANLMLRVGEQVGIGEGRPDSKNSAGMGWGTFELLVNQAG